MIEQAIHKTQPKPELVILDWKGLGKSIDRNNDSLDRVETKLDGHINDHAKGDV